MRRLPLLTIASALLCAQTKVTFEDRPAVLMSNGKLSLTVLPDGAMLAGVLLNDDSTKTNPLWEPIRMAREASERRTFTGGLGHFICLDGFGGVSKEEQAAGLPGHGEATRQQYALKSYSKDGGVETLALEATLPLVQERFTRTLQLKEGENVIYVRSRLESLVGFDRPMVWAEHATIGAPFLEAGVTVVDQSGVRSQTRPYTDTRRGPMSHRLPSGKDFEWPNAPTLDGGNVDLRAAPAGKSSGDHTTTVMDKARQYSFATALHPKKRLLVGWVWRTADFPWLQNWEHYPPTGKLARGLEFSTQPYDIPRRQAVDMHSLFDTPTFRWLPAKSTIETNFVLFYTSTPEGFTGVKDVRVENGALTIQDANGKTLKLAASLPF
jgi:hypothetical protein